MENDASIAELIAVIEQSTAYIGERLEELQGNVIACRERIDAEGSHVQDRLNEIIRLLTDLPAGIGGYVQ